MPLVAEKKRKYQAAKSREKTALHAEIGEPQLTGAQRRKGTVLRNACKNSLLKFNTLLFPNSTGLKPFGQVQKNSIGHDEQVILDGGRVCKAEPRAYGKSSRTCNAALYAALFNKRKMIPVFSANMEKSKNQIMARWRAELLGNDLLYWMFPKLIWPFRALGNKPQAAASQTYHGKLTHIQWTADRIVFPTIEDEPASGNILIALPLKSCRGATHTLPDGTILRPDLCIFDDVQKDEDADNPNTIRKIEDLIEHSALMLGGHSKTMSAIMNCTVRQPDDLSEQFLKKHGWRRVRYKMLSKSADHEKEFWLGEYADVRKNYNPESAEDQLRAQQEALDLYRSKRKYADAGAEVTWDWAYAWNDDEPTEISAIQHAYNIWIDLKEEVFASECQNEPLRDTGGLTILKPEEIRKKQSGYGRNEVPRECSKITTFVDVHDNIHYYEVWAWEPHFTGYLIDYGTFPDQQRRQFNHAMLPVPLKRLFPGHDQAATVTAGLNAIIHGSPEFGFTGLMYREWIRTDGVSMRIAMCGIDANGEESDVVKKFIRQSPFSSLMYPSFGRGIGASSMPMSCWQQSKGKNDGPEWVTTKGAVGDPVGITFDTNFWKTQFHRALALPAGSQGATYLYKVENLEHHRRISEHWYSERPKEVSCGSRTVYEFPKIAKGDNHDFDCAVGARVAASRAGITSVKKPPKKPRLSLAEHARRARGGR